MTLVRIGQTFVNFDLVTRVRDLGTKDASGAVTGPLELHFGKDHVVLLNIGSSTLRQWLASTATDATSSK